MLINNSTNYDKLLRIIEKLLFKYICMNYADSS